MKFNKFPDMSISGLSKIRKAVEEIASAEAVKYDLPDGTKIYKVASNNPKKYTIRIDMKVEES